MVGDVLEVKSPIYISLLFRSEKKDDIVPLILSKELIKQEEPQNQGASGTHCCWPCSLNSTDPGRKLKKDLITGLATPNQTLESSPGPSQSTGTKEPY